MKWNFPGYVELQGFLTGNDEIEKIHVGGTEQNRAVPWGFRDRDECSDIWVTVSP